jgi:putative spermidine/putrescine transport system ATP-binding protein
VVHADPSRQAPIVEIAGIGKRFAEVKAVDDVTLTIRRGEFFSLLGPSGCGKTTLLRLIAGLEQPSAGAMRIAGADMASVPAHRRPVNLVFQHFALFPHLSVEDNVGFGLRYQSRVAGGGPLPPQRPAGRQAPAARIAEALALVRLEKLERRYPHQLSGGQRQRVALARALVLAPQVLLLDEPLGALDRKLRKEMQLELKDLQRRLGITFVFVTHDQEEALALSDTIAVMNRGRVEQIGSPVEVFEQPETAFVAEFMGAPNFWAAEVRAVGGGQLALSLSNGLALDLPSRGASWRPGQAVRLVVRPEKLKLAVGAGGAAGARDVSVPVTVEERVYQGASTLWTVRDVTGARFVVQRQNGAPGAGPGSPPLPAAAPPEAPASAEIAPGRGAFLSWDPVHMVLLKES